MKTKLFAVAIAAGVGLVVGLYSGSCSGCGLLLEEQLELPAQRALSKDQAVSSVALAELRAKGPEGLDALFKAYAATIQRHQDPNGLMPPKVEEADWEQMKAALAAVSGQCDAYASHLYWYTDFEKAIGAARASGKPIISLRLLGNLNEEYSCANSRFFRTTLYANAEVSKYLGEHFILHWQSVRPVPKITVDFGDGRRIERTVTGNSIHYILDGDGEPIDALPGLYGPKAFLKELAKAERAALACGGTSHGEKREYLRQYHRERRAAVARDWNDDLRRIGEELDPVARAEAVASKGVTPTAQVAGRLAVSKTAIESPLLKSIQPKGDRRTAPKKAEVNDEMWVKIAALHSADARLDAGAQALILSKNPTAFEASQLATAKRLVEDPFLRAWRNLERSISEDTVRNEFLLHAQIHDWFARGTAPQDLSSLNEKVYAELFLMPSSDPWLGLAPQDTFTGLPNNGLVHAGR